jgi:hypothetical protein
VYGSGTTASNGDASASFVSGPGPSSIGTYQLKASVMSDGASATVSTTFVAQ